MKQMSEAAVERAMKFHDVILRAMAKRITWYQPAEILGISCRQMQRWKTRFEHEGYDGLFDRRRGIPSPKRVPLATVEEVLRLYQEQYFDFNVRHFHEKLDLVNQAERDLNALAVTVRESSTPGPAHLSTMALLADFIASARPRSSERYNEVPAVSLSQIDPVGSAACR